ncbi:MAG: undecaprenyldiphospho-muramoylpentapeptide beta-N-acetylglucosaminyltransferase [Betaproteobacteria bacterium RIFCSPLOWO2_02_FULL_63_19]|nr:MAG: undecaprenyldiphospho-muramoylpentapeptide beta-N-acetylglucosaminyltransferase [Betaproteobacteria bacterium RIFCSPLOWO2_02_FULL_63_19]
MAKTIMIMAGGTGGHVFPGLAVADELRERGWHVVWLGAPGGMEAMLVPKRGYEMAWAPFAGLRGKGLVPLVLLPLRLLLALWHAARAIFARRPDVLLGMGGYQSFPGALAAWLLHRPLVIHEQNSVAGLANRVLARIADRVLCAFPDALRNATVTGNPVRQDIAALPAPSQRYAARSGSLNLLVIGGSLGASILNDTVPRALALMPPERRPKVTHQSGSAHIDALAQRYRDAGVSVSAVAFIDDMASAYADADVVLCRAGALTVSELAAAGVASILVPFPHAVDDHQTGNARHLAVAGAAILLPQTQLKPERLAGTLLELSREQLRDMADKARALARPDATLAVARACMEVAG